MAKHKYYDLLNLVGYGLAKFGMPFVQACGFNTKTAFYRHFVKSGVAENENVVKNRQDLFDHFFDNGRRGWWQKGNTYLHRKTAIDALYENLSHQQFAEIVKHMVSQEFPAAKELPDMPPVVKSQFKKLQETGHAAENFFMAHFGQIPKFDQGNLTDARYFGDGYDFQIETANGFFLAEIKGVREKKGGVRMTNKEYEKAREFKADYGLVIVSNLADIPKMTPVFNPLAELSVEKCLLTKRDIEYHIRSQNW